jgi:molybdopterin-guanine dinucleotide biosynthesis protein A
VSDCQEPFPVDDPYCASRLFGPSSRVRSGSQRRFAEGRLALRDVLQELDTHVVELDPALLVNVNTVADLRALTP